MLYEINDPAELAEVVKNNDKIILDFWAPWCGPCKQIAPVITELSNEYPEIAFCKINVDSNAILGTKYEIRSIPTIVFLKNGESVNRFSGAKPKNAIITDIEKYF